MYEWTPTHLLTRGLEHVGWHLTVVFAAVQGRHRHRRVEVDKAVAQHLVDRRGVLRVEVHLQQHTNNT